MKSLIRENIEQQVHQQISEYYAAEFLPTLRKMYHDIFVSPHYFIYTFNRYSFIFYLQYGINYLQIDTTGLGYYAYFSVDEFMASNLCDFINLFFDTVIHYHFPPPPIYGKYGETYTGNDFYIYIREIFFEKKNNKLNEGKTSDNKIKKIFGSATAFKILDETEAAGSDWQMGGCWIAADALSDYYDLPLYCVYNKAHNHVDHFMVKTSNGLFMDSLGLRTIKEIVTEIYEMFLPNTIYRNAKEVRMEDLVVKPYDPSLNTGDIVRDKTASNKLVELFRKKNLNENKTVNIYNIKIKPEDWNYILKGKSVEDICKRIRERESSIADLTKGKGEEFIDCDEAAEILSKVLQIKRISHYCVLGKSDEGSSHAWVRVGNKNYDPTEQGFGNGDYELIVQYNYEEGYKQKFYGEDKIKEPLTEEKQNEPPKKYQIKKLFDYLESKYVKHKDVIEQDSNDLYSFSYPTQNGQQTIYVGKYNNLDGQTDDEGWEITPNTFTYYIKATINGKEVFASEADKSVPKLLGILMKQIIKVK